MVRVQSSRASKSRQWVWLEDVHCGLFLSRLGQHRINYHAVAGGAEGGR